MSVSGSRAAAEIDLEEFERRLRAAGAPQAGIEDPLAELTRLVETSKAQAANPPPSANVVSAFGRLAREPAPPAETAPPAEAALLRPALGEAKKDEPVEPEAEAVEPPQAEDAEEFLGRDPKSAERPAQRGSARWKVTVSALALAGAAMIGAVFVMKAGVPGLSKVPPFIAAAQGPTKVKPPSDETVASSKDAGAALMKDNAPPAQVKVVNTEEQPVDLSAATAAPPPAAPPPAASAPASTGSTVPASADAFAGATAAQPGKTIVAATVNTPVVAPPPPAPPPLASQFPDPRPVRTVSLRPDGTPISAPASPIADTSQPSPPAEAQTAAAEPASKAAKNDAAGTAQPSTPKLDLPAKPAKSSARVVVAKTETTAPGAAETPSQPLQLGTAKREKAEKVEKVEKVEKAQKPPKPTQTAAAEPPPAAPAAPAPAAEQPVNPIANAISSLVGGKPATAAPVPQPVDPTAATASGGWSVQLAAPRSETEAKSDLERLNAKYATALNGSSIGVHKASVNGETVYRLRVVGLTKADAAALCARVKGDGGNCFIAK